MENTLIEKLKSEYGPLSWFDGGRIQKLNEGWFLLETTPLPPSDEIEKVAIDIENHNILGLQNGQVRHYPNCKSKTHTLRSKVIRDSLQWLKPITYKVAVYPKLTNNDIFGDQPIAIVLDPEISFLRFPDHPHLNAGGRYGDNGFFFHDSLCYTDKPDEIGTNEEDRLFNAFFYITVWLFKHQIWQSSKRILDEGIWIGKGVSFKTYAYHPLFLNPDGQCRCGNRKSYKECHRFQDLMELKKIRAGGISLNKAMTNWQDAIRLNKESLTLLKRVLLK